MDSSIAASLLAGDEAALSSARSELLDQAADLATTITREFRLIGVNGIDFIARGGVLYPIEVNPRFSASYGGWLNAPRDSRCSGFTPLPAMAGCPARNLRDP